MKVLTLALIQAEGQQHEKRRADTVSEAFWGCYIIVVAFQLVVTVVCYHKMNLFRARSLYLYWQFIFRSVSVIEISSSRRHNSVSVIKMTCSHEKCCLNSFWMLQYPLPSSGPKPNRRASIGVWDLQVLGLAIFGQPRFFHPCCHAHVFQSISYKCQI